MLKAKNYEIKTRIDNIPGYRKLAQKFQTRFKKRETYTEFQHDVYYDVKNDRLKLRIINKKTANLILYNRKEKNLKRVSNYTTACTKDFKQLHHILSSQFEILTEVKKKREIFICDEIRIHLDSVEGLGKFLEFEVIYKDLNIAKKKMKELINFFGLDQKKFIKDSYSGLLSGK